MAILHLDPRRQAPAIALPKGFTAAVAVVTLLGIAVWLAVIVLPEVSAGTVHSTIIIGMLSAALFGIWRGPVHARPEALEVEIERAVANRTAELRTATLSLEKEILERRLAEERTAEGKRRLDELIMRTNTATVLIDSDMRVVDCNHALARLLGRGTVDELIGRDLVRLFGLRDDRTLRHFCAEALRLGSFDCEFDATPPTRGAVSVEAHGVSSVVNGRPCVMALLRDISERKAAARELTQSREALGTALELAREANASRSVFLAKMNHELRTPLNGIIGLSEILRHKASGETVRPAELRRLCDSIHQSGAHMLSLVEDLTDLSRLDTGSRVLDAAQLSVRYEIDTAVATIAPTAGRKRITIENACEAAVEWTLDRRSFRQIVINLVGNAVKFSPPDSHVRIAVTCSIDAMALHVSDEGPGIGAGERERILVPFGRGRQAEANGIDGQGLGLAIVSELLSLQGGTLEIDAESGRGSTFTAVFPLGAEQKPILQLAAE